jgi:hypothetical protein
MQQPRVFRLAPRCWSSRIATIWTLAGSARRSRRRRCPTSRLLSRRIRTMPQRPVAPALSGEHQLRRRPTITYELDEVQARCSRADSRSLALGNPEARSPSIA